MSVLLSLKEKHADNILSGEKYIEVRKSFPKRYKRSFPVYLYQTMDANKDAGLVVGKATCQAVYRMRAWSDEEYFRVVIGTMPYCADKIGNAKPIDGICITQEELLRYQGHAKLYGWLLSKPVRFERPLALDGFLDDSAHPIERAPQSWQYCWRPDGV